LFYVVQIEYLVENCSSENRARNDCVHVQVAKQILPRGGDIVFSVGHLHSGGIASSLHGEVVAITNSINLFAHLSRGELISTHHLLKLCTIQVRS
jgi:hypothetical protein